MYDRDDIINTLNNGTHIVCDRYAFSGVVYSAAKGVGKNLIAFSLTLVFGLELVQASR